MATATNPYHEFLRKVYRMRKAQKDAKRFNSQVTQRSVESLEREVDKWLESAGIEAAKVKQMKFNSAMGSVSVEPVGSHESDPFEEEDARSAKGSKTES